ncbi:Zona pellucida-like domain containing protein, partial [Euroglyphus maynei]
MNFQGDEIDCWMSIQEGKGPWSNEINRIVTVGQPLTIVVAINDKKNQFDMKVKSCFAHDGIRAPIYLIDEDGCILRTKMISPFQKIRGLKGKASLISYAQFLAFKFPDSVDVQIQCTVEVCRNGCMDTCNDGISSNPQQQRPRHQDHHRNDFHKDTIFKIENVTSHRFLMDNKDDLLVSADTNKEPITADVHIINSDNKDSVQPLHIVNDDDMSDENDKRNYLDIIADYLHNIMTIPLSPIYSMPMPLTMGPMTPPIHHQPSKSNGFGSLLNPFNSLKLFSNGNNNGGNGIVGNKKYIPQIFSNYFQQKRPPPSSSSASMMMNLPNDNFELLLNSAIPSSPNGGRIYRSRRYINDKQGEIGLKKGFQV